MAKPITVSPVLRGKDAENLRREILEGTPMTPERKETFRMAAEVMLAFQGRSPLALPNT